MQLPPELEKRLEKIGLSTDIYDKRPRKCIRVNTIKASVNEIVEKIQDLEQVPFCSDAFFIEKNTDSSKYISDSKHKTDYEIKRLAREGKVYIQDASSLIPVISLDPQSNDQVLDMCAAPGTKTTHIAQLMKNSGFLGACEINKKRAMRLRNNIKTYGIWNTKIYAKNAIDLQGSVDKILLDAPCSGEGIIGKMHKTMHIWSENRIKYLQKQQKNLIEKAFSLLNPNGTLVYSTCTFEPEENEEVIDYLLKNHSDAKMEQIKIPGLKFKQGLQLKDYTNEVKKCIRIYPSLNGTNGFFVAKIRKCNYL